METEDPAMENIFVMEGVYREIWDLKENAMKGKEREMESTAREHEDCEKPQIANKALL